MTRVMDAGLSREASDKLSRRVVQLATSLDNKPH